MLVDCIYNTNITTSKSYGYSYKLIISDYKLSLFSPKYYTTGSYGIQSVSISTDNGVLCILCTFMIGSDNEECFMMNDSIL